MTTITTILTLICAGGRAAVNQQRSGALHSGGFPKLGVIWGLHWDYVGIIWGVSSGFRD